MRVSVRGVLGEGFGGANCPQAISHGNGPLLMMIVMLREKMYATTPTGV